MEAVTRVKDGDVRTRVSVLENQIVTMVHNIEKLEIKVDDQYQMLHARISDMREDLRDDIDANNERVMQKLDEHMRAERQSSDKLNDKLASLEKWKWTIMGGAIVVGYVLAHLKLEKLF
jgi:predicted RNase H-like nuclease (RuvC/YqgF family)